MNYFKRKLKQFKCKHTNQYTITNFGGDANNFLIVEVGEDVEIAVK